MIRRRLLAGLLLLWGMLYVSAPWLAGLTTWLWPQPARAATTLYVTNNGSGTDCAASPGIRCDLSTALGKAVQGDIISLESGTTTAPKVYQGVRNMIAAPDGKNGTQAAPITIRAEVEGGVLLDGQWINEPINFSNNKWWVLQGVNAKNAKRNVVNVANSSQNITIERVIAWDAVFANKGNVFQNYHSGGTSLTTATRVIDSAFFGVSTITCNNFGDQYLYMQRVYCRNDGSQSDGAGHESFDLSYGDGPAMCDNCIGSWFEHYPTSWRITTVNGVNPTTAGTCTQGGVTVDRSLCDKAASQKNGNCDNFPEQPGFGVVTEPWCPIGPFRARSDNTDGSSSPTYINGSIFYVPTNTTASGNLRAAFTSDPRAAYTVHNRHFQHTISFIPPGLIRKGPGTTDTTKGLYLRNLGGGDSTADHMTSVSAEASPATPSGWTVTNPASATTWGGLPANAQNPWTNTGSGANLCKRWHNGAVTTEPLWPWPMNQRLKDATTTAPSYAGPCLDCSGAFAARPVVDLTAEIESMFGTIPASCRTGDGGAGPIFPITTGPSTPIFDQFTTFTGYTTVTGNGWNASGGQARPTSGFSVVRTNTQFAVDQEVYAPIGTLPTADDGLGLQLNARITDNNNKVRATIFTVSGSANDTAKLDHLSTGNPTVSSGTIALGFDAAVGDSLLIRAIGPAVDLIYQRASEPGVWRTITSITAASAAQAYVGMAGGSGGLEALGGGSLSTQVPLLVVEPASLTFSAIVGGANPPSQLITITDSANLGTMQWTCETNAAWLACAPASGTGNRQVAMTVTTSGLPSGNHNAVVTVTAPDSTTPTDTVAVSLSLNPSTTPTSGRGGRVK